MPPKARAPPKLYDFEINDITGKPVDMNQFRGKVVLIANVASECGLTADSYTGFAKLLDKYEDQGFAALLCPCNQFRNQEPGDNACIRNFALRYHTKFVTTEKIEVNGANAHPMFEWLKVNARGFMINRIKWNFTKFLVDRHGHVHPYRFSPFDKPEKMVTNLEMLLAQK